MAFVPAPNIVELELRALRGASRIENRIMVNVLTAPTPAILNELAQLGWDWWENFYSIVLSNGIVLRESVTTDLSAQDGQQVIYAPDTTTTGQRASSSLPNEVSVCVSLRTSARGRSARGRFFALSVCQDQLVDNNTLSVVAAGQYVSVVGELLTQIQAAGYQPSIVSYISNKVPRPGGPVYYPISGATLVDNIVDSQKRRKPGIGI